MRLHPPEIDVHSTAYDRAEAESSIAGSTWRRRLSWIGGALALVVLLVLLPPLINANRYRNKIAQTMSGSLGRPVHLDNVSLHLLPVPGFTLRNLVVSEDPEFGAEPIIRANTVEATLRATSLWHRPVEFSTIRFVEPSVNLVRNADGRWNLSDVLLHASHVNTAPTDQRKAGPTARFPYIEATGGRVNVKFGLEKLPFSLTDADFALWLPSPQQWRVRLVGHPARTDTNITDPGVVRLEGQLSRASTAAEVPVNFRAYWHDAPLGEASRMVSGDDLGWRGSLNMDATMAGTLGDARLSTKLTLGGLRRAEFFPARPLDLQITCDSGFALYPAMLRGLACRLPDDAPAPLALQAEAVHLDNVRSTSATLRGAQIPARWALLWAALFSSRVPTDLHPTGTVDVDLVHNAPAASAGDVSLPRKNSGRHKVKPTPAPTDSHGGWAGTVTARLPVPGAAEPAEPGANAAENVLTWQLVPASGSWPSLHLPVTPVSLGPAATVSVSATLSESGYTLSVAGNASAAALLEPARYLPELGDGVEKILPFPPTASVPAKVQFTCGRAWTAPQTCTGLEPAATPQRTSGAPGLPAPSRTGQIPSVLTPRSLSPFENAPLSGAQTPSNPR